jgi:hypothetical protein
MLPPSRWLRTHKTAVSRRTPTAIGTHRRLWAASRRLEDRRRFGLRRLTLKLFYHAASSSWAVQRPITPIRESRSALWVAEGRSGERTEILDRHPLSLRDERRDDESRSLAPRGTRARARSAASRIPASGSACARSGGELDAAQPERSQLSAAGRLRWPLRRWSGHAWRSPNP